VQATLNESTDNEYAMKRTSTIIGVGDVPRSFTSKERISMRSDVRDMFDRLAMEYDEVKLRVIPGYRQVTGRSPRTRPA